MTGITPWRQLLQSSLDSNKHLLHAKYFQLATVKVNGTPANRTVVFRGFVDGTDKLQFTTDARSRKVEEINIQPYGEICCYFTDSWEQFRMHGKLDVIGSSDTDTHRQLIWEKAWFGSSPKSRLQFYGPHPGYPSLESETVADPQIDPKQGPLDTFCVLTLDPEEVVEARSNEVGCLP